VRQSAKFFLPEAFAFERERPYKNSLMVVRERERERAGGGACASRAPGGVLYCMAFVLVLLPGICGAATNAAPAQDPMITLMLSQPRLDTSAPVRAEASFDPPVARPGDRVVYRLTLNALRDVISWNGELPSAGRLEFRPGASGQIMEMVGTNFQPRTSFNFHSRAPAEGKHVAPSFPISVAGNPVQVPEAFLISANVQTSVPPQMLYLEVEPETPFVGQAVRVRILSPGLASGIVQALGQVQLGGEGFIHELTAGRQSVQHLPFQGRSLPHYIYETTLTPISAGNTRLYAQGFSVGNRFSGPVVISGPATISSSMLRYTLLDSDPMELVFRPLPPEGRPPGFSGAVGVYSVDPPQLSADTIHPGEPVQMTVTIRGRGNLGRLVVANPPTLADWQVLPARRENLPIQVVESRGFISFIYTLVPLRGGLKATPELPFSFFNPEVEKYVVQNVPSAPVTVLPGSMPADLDALLRQRLSQEPKEPELSLVRADPGATVASLTPVQLRPWFPFVQAAPAVLFLALWQWDRRRRFLEAHPEVVLRRRARRELKRERRRMDAAARRGDAAVFRQSAVRAVQVASAPNYPAHPGAVLSTDVLGLIAGRSADAAGAVERLFEASNAERYAGRAPVSLMEDREKLMCALDILEEKL